MLLSAFVDDIDRHFAEKKRRQFAAQARVLIMDDDHNTVEIADGLGTVIPRDDVPVIERLLGALHCSVMTSCLFEDSLFQMPRCRISRCAAGTVNMVKRALEEATRAPSGTCQLALYGAARDILDLWRAIVVARYANTLQKVPQLCAIFHNDCQYLAYHCIILGYEFKAKLQPPLDQWGTFVDTVPTFRELADRHMVMMIQAQRHEIKTALDNAALQGLARSDDEASRSLAEKGLLRVKHHLEHLQAAID